MCDSLRPTITEGPAGFQTKNSAALKKHKGLRRCGHVATGTAEKVQSKLGNPFEQHMILKA